MKNILSQLFITIILFITPEILSQNSNFEIKLSAENMTSDFDYGKSSSISPSLGLNYYLKNYIDIGVSIGWLYGTNVTPLSHYDPIENMYYWYSIDSLSYRGTNSNYFLINLILC
jgi:hypothetical protein